MTITPQTWKLLGTALAAATIPLTNIVLRHWAVLGPDVKDVLDLLSIITTIGGGAGLVFLSTPAAQVAAAGSLPGVNVIVGPGAPAGAQAAAADPNVPGVNPSPKGP